MSDATTPDRPTGRSAGELFAKVPALVRDDLFGDLEKGRVFEALFGEPIAESKISRFRLLEHIGSGGMARVFAAYDEQLDRKVAIKVVRPRDAASTVSNQRLLREAQTLAQLSHPNIVQVYEAGDHGDAVFIAMEFVRGQTLSEWLSGTHELPRRRRWREILALFMSAGRGLEAAHRAGLVHRDFKPDNVLVGDDGRVRVADFGMARAISQPQADDSERRRDARQEPTEPDAAAGDGRDLATQRNGGLGSTPSNHNTQSRQRLGRDSTVDAGSTVRRLAGATLSATRDDAVGDAVAGERGPGALMSLDTQAVADGSLGKAGVRLTVTGTVMGTPRFMSPEQMIGRAVDHRSDQFSFCVALFSALYGECPFDATDLRARLEMIQRGELATPRGQSDVPASVRRAIVRGLRANPDERFPDMSALLRALERWRLRRRGVAIAVAVIALMGAGASTFAVFGGQPDVCAGVGQELDAMWTAERQRGIAAAFEQSGVAYAGTAWQNAQRRLDDYAERWRETATATCENPRRRDSTVHRLCLDGAMQRFDALLTRLERSAGDTLDKAVENTVRAVSRLPNPRECDDADLLSLGMEPPPVEQADTVRALRERLTHVRTQELLGDYLGAEQLLEQVRADAVGVSYEPLHAEILYQLARVQAKAGGAQRAERAEQAFLEALDIAEGVRHDRLVVDIWHELVDLAEQNHADLARGYAWSHRERAAVRRVGDAPSHRASAYHSLGRLHIWSGDYAAAETEIRRAIDIHRSADPDAVPIAHYYHDLANTQWRRGDHLEAWTMFEKALALQISHYGADHPQVARLQIDFAQMLLGRGEVTRARGLFYSALATWEQTVGVNSRQVGRVHVNLAEIEANAGDLNAARAHAEQALAIYHEIAPPGHYLQAEPYMVVGIIERYARRWDAALSAFETALEIRQRHFKPSQQEIMWAEMYISDVFGRMGEFEQALRHCEPLLDSGEVTSAPPSLRAMSLTACGRAYRGLDRRAAGLASLEAAVRLFREVEGLPWEQATAYSALAHALQTSGEAPPKRACVLASEARSLFEAGGDISAPMIDELDALRRQCDTR
ncbi:MAG: hypothetical protein Tsb0020_19550 [Haliangiales bacterium]